MWPTKNQKTALKKYIDSDGDFSIYGRGGIYHDLESLICKEYDVKNCLLTNTGTSALSSAYFALGIEQGDEVIVPVYTFIATITPLYRLGAIPVFADADPDTGQISSESIKALITKKTKAVAITHMWGIPCEVEKIKKICQDNNLYLIEDASHSHLTKYKNKYLGTYGDIGCFSVGARKIISGGEGGFLITNNREFFIRATLLGHFIKRAEEELVISSPEIFSKYKDLTSGFGENYRMHPYAAVMIKEFIEKDLQSILEIRYKCLSLLNKELSKNPLLITPKITYGAMYGYKPKLLISDKKIDELIFNFKENGLKLKRLDTTPLYDDKAFSKGKFLKKYPGADEYMKGRISIPNYTSEDEKESIEITRAYIKLFKKLLK